ncbi:putative PEP-binding protein, partial [Mycoplasmopsis synoviae]
IGTPNDVESVLENDAQGIGLFRSEFLYMNNENWPTEDEQFLAYKKVIEQMNNQRVVIRTLDIGGDKTLKYYKFPEELNPFLGFRAIRFWLQNEDVFKTQLKALIRASEFGRVSVMFPMITTLDEFLRA